MNTKYLLLLLLAACGNPDLVVAPQTPGAAQKTTPKSSRGFVVWSRADKQVQTVLLDDTGTVQAEANGVVVAVDGKLVAIEEKKGTRALGSCAQYGGGDEGESEFESLVTRALESQETRVIVPSYFDRKPGKHDGDAPISEGTVRQGMFPLASVGPYLFVHEDMWEYACGAHGNWYRAPHVVDLRTGKDVDVKTTDDAPANKVAHAAFLDLAQENPDAANLWNNGDPGELSHVAIEPHFEDGRFVFLHVFLAEACYACGATEWRSYANEVEVAAETPHLFEGALVPPPAVAGYLEKLGRSGKYELGGFSEVPDSIAAGRALRSLNK